MATETAALTQDNRPIGLTATSLGKDKLLIEQFSMSEGLSRPFRLSVACLAAPDYTLPFEKLLGQNATVRLDVPGGGEARYFNGIVYKITEGAKVHSPDTGKFLMRYWVELMPSFVSLRSRVQSRIFQHLSIPDILKKVLTGLYGQMGTQGDIPAARLLRAVSRIGFSIRLAADGRGGHLLFLQAHGF